MRVNLKQKLATFHRWAGLLLGLYIAFVALTGALMVFQGQLYALELGEERVGVPPGDGPWALPSRWFSLAEAQYGPLHDVEGIFGPRVTPMRIEAPTIIYEADLEGDGGHGHGVVTVNPYTGEPLANFVAENTLAMWALRLHNNLFLGDWSPLSMLALCVVALVFVITGVMLWWPRRGRWQAALKPAGIRSAPAMRKSHTSLGAWLAVPIVIFSVSGLGLALPGVANSFAQALGRSEGRIETRTITGACEKATMDSAWQAALAAMPDYQITMFLLPPTDDAPYTIYMRPIGDEIPLRGPAEIRVSSDCGIVVFARDEQTNLVGDTVLTYLIDLHNGRILGGAGDVVVLALGLLIATLPLLGIGSYMLRKRRAARITY